MTHQILRTPKQPLAEELALLIFLGFHFLGRFVSIEENVRLFFVVSFVIGEWDVTSYRCNQE